METDFHDLFPKIPHELAGTAVLCALFGVTGAVHVIPALYVLNSDGIDNDMNMEVSGAVVSVCMSAHKSLMSGEVLLAEPLPDLVDLLQREIMVSFVPWVERNDVMVAFYIAFVLVLTVFEIRLDALHRIGIRGAVNAGNQIFLPRHIMTMLIQNGALALLVMLIFQIKLSCPIIGVFAGQMLNDCHKSFR